MYATTKTVTTSTTTTTYTYTPLPSPTKPTNDLSVPPRPKSVALQPSRPISRGRSVESKRVRACKPSKDTGHAFVFPRDVSTSKSSLVPKASAPAIPPPSCSSTAKSPKSMLAKYAFPNPAVRKPTSQQLQPKLQQSMPPQAVPLSLAPSSSNPLQSLRRTFAHRYTRIIRPEDLVGPKIGIETYYVVLCGQEVGIFFSL